MPNPPPKHNARHTPDALAYTQNSDLETQRINHIRTVIRDSGDRWRARYPFLSNKNAMGFGVFAFSIGGILWTASAYLNGDIHAFSCIVIVAILSSLLHELEHDLIHWQYFKRRKVIHHIMMLGVWLFRPGTINPWIRRRLHLLHHKTSGTEHDLEERGIGNGQSFSWLRWWIMCDPFAGNLAKIFAHNERRKAYRVLRLLVAYFPFGVLSALCWYTFIAFHAADFTAPVMGHNMAWDAAARD